MKSDYYFDECKDCMYREYSDELFCCAGSRLGLALHKLIKELPIISKFVDDYKYCGWYQKEEEL